MAPMSGGSSPRNVLVGIISVRLPKFIVLDPRGRKMSSAARGTNPPFHGALGGSNQSHSQVIYKDNGKRDWVNSAEYVVSSQLWGYDSPLLWI